jgi:hypothetical protein
MRQHFAADLMLAFGIGVIDDHGPIGVAAVFRLSTGPDDIRIVGPLDWLGGEQP